MAVASLLCLACSQGLSAALKLSHDMSRGDMLLAMATIARQLLSYSNVKFYENNLHTVACVLLLLGTVNREVAEAERELPVLAPSQAAMLGRVVEAHKEA